MQRIKDFIWFYRENKSVRMALWFATRTKNGRAAYRRFGDHRYVL